MSFADPTPSAAGVQVPAERADDPPKLTYLPALDGVRAICVIAVLLFHGGITWAVGGYLGVSTFFTLSGYLITSLLLAERLGTGTIDLRAFWRRRFRRLLPASLVCIAGVVLFGLLAASPDQRAELGGDVVASLAYVANWWFLASGESYSDLFVAPSPLLHFWSLAIEEQFYLLFPLLVWGIALVRRRPAEDAGGTSLALRLGLGLGVLTAATAALPFLFDLSDDWLYYATPARAPELLLGALAAVALHARHRRARLERGTPATTVVASGVGLAALALMGWLWATTPQTSAWLYEGGLPAYAVISTALIVALHVPGAVATRLLAVRPLRHLGRISYGVYLYHWPLYLWLDERRTGLEGWPLLALRVTVTLVIAELSFRLVELPIRRSGRLRTGGRPVRLARWAPASAVALAAAALLVAASAPAPLVDIERSEERIREQAQEDPAPPPPDLIDPDDEINEEVDPLDALPEKPPDLRAAVFGDSTALMVSFGLGPWAREQPDAEVVPGSARLGCGLDEAGQRRFGDEELQVRPSCRTWPLTWPANVRTFAPNLAVVQVGPWEVLDQRRPGDEFRALGDPVHDERSLENMIQAVDALNSEGSYVVWMTMPLPNANVDPAGQFGRPELRDGERIRRLNELIAQLPEHRPDGVEVLDMAEYHDAIGEEDLRLRPDGVHLGEEVSMDLAESFLGPELRDRFEQAWIAGPARQLAAEALEARAELPPLRQATDGEDVRILLWGDGDAEQLAAALDRWALDNDAGVRVAGVGPEECGITRPDARRAVDGSGEVVPSTACKRREALRSAMRWYRPHLVALAPGTWEVGEHYLPAEPEWVNPGYAPWDEWVRLELTMATDALRQVRSGVVAITTPVPGDAGEATTYTRVLNGLLAQVAQAPARSNWSELIDLAALAEEDPPAPPGDGEPAWAGLSADAVAALVGPALVEAAEELRAEASGTPDDTDQPGDEAGGGGG